MSLAGWLGSFSQKRWGRAMQGLTTKRHREPKQRTKPLKEDHTAHTRSGMCVWEIIGKQHALMGKAREVGRG